MNSEDRYFHEVATTGSLRKAAESLHVATSAISRKIALLEARLGIDLLERTSQGMTATEAGLIYLDYTRQIRLERELVLSEIDRLKGLGRGHLRIVTIEGGLINFVMDAIAKLRVSHPAISYEVKIAGTHSVKKAVNERQADIGIAMGGFSQEDSIEIAFQLGDRLLVAVNPEHELAERPSLKVADVIEGYAYALPDASFGIRSLIANCTGRSKLSPALEANSFAALKIFARQRNGLSFLPFLAVRDALESGELVGIPLEDEGLNVISLEVLVAKGRRLSPAAKALLAELQAVSCEYATPAIDHAKTSAN